MRTTRGAGGGRKGSLTNYHEASDSNDGGSDAEEERERQPMKRHAGARAGGRARARACRTRRTASSAGDRCGSESAPLSPLAFFAKIAAEAAEKTTVDSLPTERDLRIRL